MNAYIFYRFNNIDMKTVLAHFVNEFWVIDRGSYHETPYLDSPWTQFTGKEQAIVSLNKYKTVGEAYIHSEGIKMSILIGTTDNILDVSFRGSIDKDVVDFGKVLQIKDQFESAMRQAGYPVQILESTFPEPATTIAA